MTGSGQRGLRGPAVALLLLVVGIGLRIWATEHARFTEEESLFWVTARDIVLGRDLPRYGPSLTGSEAFHPGPLFYYLMALPQSLGSSPRLGSVFVALLHGLAGGLLWLTLRRVAGLAPALVALALWTFAPWDVLYADRIWLSCVAPVWGTATLYAAVRASTSAPWQGVLLFFCIGAPQLHMSAPILWAAVGVWLALRPPTRWSKASLAVGLLLGAALYAPTYAFEITHGFENTFAILRKSTGKSGLHRFVNAPLRVFGYAVLSASAEIGYHFSTGYWHPFAERDAYLFPSGWVKWARLHGPLFGALTLASVGVAFSAWGTTVVGLGRRAREAWRASTEATRRGRLRSLRGLSAGDHLTLTLLSGLGAAVLLLVLSRKGYYPHYTNLFVPFTLWPAAAAIAGWLAAERSRRWGAAALGVTMAAMASATVRYYAQVDALNGLAVTEGLVAKALEVEGPVQLVFTGFDNRAAWQNLAQERFERPLVLEDDAPVVLEVHNQARFEGDVPAGGVVVGSVLMTRRLR